MEKAKAKQQGSIKRQTYKPQARPGGAPGVLPFAVCGLPFAV
jgi:hypothetical protein